MVMYNEEASTMFLARFEANHRFVGGLRSRNGVGITVDKELKKEIVDVKRM
ncbi:hypothetical protein MTR_5g071490 [Medicago truncatula]|uniref:Uncharacterized protein n=1 Tax=Medicago truncatula TaxID=3880 RepID=G7JZL1_MEDTR|nr:hypothetical protein MTR_5g071490 [Medicago truncatula]